MSSRKQIDHPEIGHVEFKKRKGQRSIRLTLKPGKVVVSMPYYTPFIVARKFLDSKIDWVHKHSQQSEKFYSGMHIGKSYRLQITPGSTNKSRITQGSIKVSGSDMHIKKTIIKALKLESEALIRKRLEYISQVTKLEYSDVKFRHLTGRWGSCSSDKVLTFNVLLVQHDWKYIDYVIVHELCHTVYMNHSAQFWGLVERKSPNYKQLRRELKKYQPLIFDTSAAYS